MSRTPQITCVFIIDIAISSVIICILFKYCNICFFFKWLKLLWTKIDYKCRKIFKNSVCNKKKLCLNCFIGLVNRMTSRIGYIKINLFYMWWEIYTKHFLKMPKYAAAYKIFRKFSWWYKFASCMSVKSREIGTYAWILK